jgi:hypothetical protein
MYTHTYTYIHIVRENRTILLGLSEGTMGSRRGKENVRE